MRRSLAPQPWENWARTVACEPAHRAYPVTLEEVQAEVLRCAEEGERLRVIGRGHSFTPLCHSDENQMSLDRFTGIDGVDMAQRRVWVRAGTRLHRLGEMLADRGLALDLFSDSKQQTLAGAISTGTHGTGRTVGSLSTLVTGLRMVLADGSVRTFTADDGEVFDAVRLSLGALGVITHVELACRDSYRLEVRRQRTVLDTVLAQLDDLRREHRHLSLYWYPFTRHVQLITRNETTAPATRVPTQRFVQDVLTDNVMGWGLSRMTRSVPAMAERSSRLATRGLRDHHWVAEAHNAFAAPRWVRYVESEYAVPVANLGLVLRQMQRLIEALQFRVHLPVTIRFAPADPLWLSPAHGRDVAYIAIHMAHGMPYADYFAAMGDLFDRHGGRPHWGKLHDKTARELRKLYPRFNDFLALRQQLDPRGVLLNRYLSGLLDVRER
ncbi:FAD-binding protein [Flagellatimonas centrodinii]|uniref:D-arabinono-1,4-lactone oxidase n=1 Tax=Flagellatimonas centrodinii TaxID=2806210 RepID=UPI001FF01E0F|nr:D-arabinono-1,4-lactone oxidase [Flagellatimonas centrodinii]ULQ46763.1 FAD-binding protein [Flagellatimonas centrodinii]